MKKVIFILFALCLISLPVSAQTNCAAFADLIREGDALFGQGKYKQAINKYQAAMTNCPNKMAEVQPKIAKVFNEIEQLRFKAENAQKIAKANESKALALLEDIAARELYQAEQSILKGDWQAAYEYLRSIKTQDPKLILWQKQSIVRLLYKELYEAPVEQWAYLAGFQLFKQEGNAIVVDVQNQQSIFGTALNNAAQKPNKIAARQYILAELERILGKEVFNVAHYTYSHKKPYSFTFQANDFEAKPKEYSEAYQPPANELASEETEASIERESNTKIAEKIDYNRLVMQAYEKGDYAAAYQYQLKAVAQDSTNNTLWFNLSFFALYNDAPQVAIQAAKKSLSLRPDAQSACTNLALGYLLNNEWKKAEKIYWYWKDQVFPDERENRTCKEIFLQDIADLEAKGIQHKHFKKVRKLLEE